MSTIGREEFEKKLPREWKKENRQKVLLAYRLAKYGHRGQLRDSGERYFEHPKRVALILMDELKDFDPEMLIVALLHDIKEDSFILTWEDIKLIFGEPVYKMIQALTKDKSLGKGEREEDYLRKLMAAEKAIKIIKLADRLDNLRDLCGLSPTRKKEYPRETIVIFLPMAQEVDEYLFQELRKLCKSYLKSKEVRNGKVREM